jgi:hypothetical protein
MRVSTYDMELCCFVLLWKCMDAWWRVSNGWGWEKRGAGMEPENVSLLFDEHGSRIREVNQGVIRLSRAGSSRSRSRSRSLTGLLS